MADRIRRGKPQAARPCETCARWFLPGQPYTQFCSQECSNFWRSHRLRPRLVRCHDCGTHLAAVSGESRIGDATPGGGPRWCVACSVERKRETNRRKNAKKAGRPRNATCPKCGARHKAAGTTTRCEACTRASVIAPSSRIRWRQCRACDRWLTRDSYCDSHCRALNVLRYRNYLSTDIVIGDCARCGSAFVRQASLQARFCSPLCAKRDGRSRRKHNRRAAVPSGERFTSREIFERDGWRCHLCGLSVPDRPYAARDKDPTIDHLIPVSDGGLHVRSNVRLAHNRCNWERKTGGQVQLLLVG